MYVYVCMHNDQVCKKWNSNFVVRIFRSERTEMDLTI